jgi:hypothetical protein
MFPSTTQSAILIVDKHTKLDRCYISGAKRNVSMRHDSVLPLSSQEVPIYADNSLVDESFNASVKRPLRYRLLFNTSQA